jgi:hypothetical protein
MRSLDSRTVELLVVLALVASCKGVAEGPLGIPLADNGVTYAGVATIDLTPTITETFTDVNENHLFDGCMDDPTASGAGCDEPFDDVDGDGWFDAVFIGGFDPLRPALGVHDDLSARALVVAQDEAYLALVALDLVGLGSPRIDAARDRLVEDEFEGSRLLVASTHNHQGPDTIGIWGNPYDFTNPITGRDEAYQERVTDAIEIAVREAAGSMEPVTLTVGRLHMRDRGPWFNGERFGGKNPVAKMHGMIRDIRDPVLVSDQLLVLQGTLEDGSALFTWTNWSGHPEVRDGGNNEISADWVGVARAVLEETFPGSTALHMPESLGGMQSALGGDLPLVEEDGTHVFQTCGAEAVADAEDPGCYGKSEGDVRTDEDGDEVPEWAERHSWEFVTSHGWHIAEAAIDALEDGEEIDAAPIRVDVEEIYVPVENIVYQLLGPSGMFDLDFDDAVEDPALCPEAVGTSIACLPTHTLRAQVGPLGFVGVPGELLPELAWGLPAGDADWDAEVDDPAARGGGSVYFPQHDPDCNALEYSDCVDELSLGECDCLKVHAWPYELNPDPAVPPMLDLLDTEYRAVLGMTGDYVSYIIPEPDFNTRASMLTDDGDHYEETVSPAHNFATRIQEGQLRIDDRW